MNLLVSKLWRQQDCYTSKTSALDLELPRRHKNYVGKRVKRGLFLSATGKVINADINGSLHIIRKKFPGAFTAEGIVSCAVQPILVNPISR
uniref:hypothetical protein n=1 Tax=Okeania sp. SIO2F4 TaxID=2607790 RepID=UPI0025E1278B|nr:hypothetical protein [Okeania sp. SIO2F4]